MSGLRKEDIAYLYKRGRKIHTQYLIFFFLPYNELKIAPVVSKKISKKAVVRNKIKRRLRHIAKEMLNKGKYIIVAKEDISNIDFEKLKNDFEKFIKKAH